MSSLRRPARLFALPFHLAFCLAIVRFLASAAPSPRAERAAFELRAAPCDCAADLAPLTLPPAPRRRSRSGTLAPSKHPWTPRPSPRSNGARRPLLLAIRRRRPWSQGGRGSPPPPHDPPPPSDPAGAGLYLMRLAPFIVRMLLRFGVPDRDVEDVAQEAIITAHRKWSSFEGGLEGSHRSARRSWVLAIAWRTAASYQRNARREPPLLDNPDDTSLDPGDYDAPDTERRLDLRRLGAILAELECATTAARWSIFVAYEIEGLDLPRIAEREGLPSGTVSNRLRLARRDLRAALVRRGIKGPNM